MKHLYIYITLVFITGCAPIITELAESDPESVVARKDKLLSGDNVSEETVTAIIDAHNFLGIAAISVGNYETGETLFNYVLTLNKTNKQAKYGLAMIAGHRLFKKEVKQRCGMPLSSMVKHLIIIRKAENQIIGWGAPMKKGRW